MDVAFAHRFGTASVFGSSRLVGVTTGGGVTGAMTGVGSTARAAAVPLNAASN